MSTLSIDDRRVVADAHLFLAKFYKSKGDLAVAEDHCKQLLDQPMANKEEAKALLRDIHSQRSQS